MVAKYTPGPWRIERGRVVDRSGNVVARVPVENRSLAEVREGSGNTQLIAQSPRMYELLKQCASVVANAPASNDGMALYPKLIALIDEVEGESSNRLESREA